MDDTPDKLRRNVVALSAAILAIAFFHLTFKPTGNLLGFAEVGNVSALKVWVALSAVLAYAFMRYRFEDTTREALKHLAEESGAFRAHILEKVVAYDMRRCMCGRPRLFGYLPDYEVELLSRYNFPKDRKGRPDPGRVTAEIKRQNTNPVDGMWTAYMAITAQNEPTEVTPDGRGRVKLDNYGVNIFVKSRARRGAIHAVALLLGLWSKGFADVVVPFACAIFASWVCAYQVAYYTEQALR